MENNTDMQQYLDGTVATNVTGFYCGRPNEHNDELYKETVIAKSEGEEA